MTLPDPAGDDPFVTTREAAELLGVSLKTAQVWFEQGGIPSWKTPGGHRRARRSAVMAMRKRDAKRSDPRLHQAILVHRASDVMQARVEQLRLSPFPVHLCTGDLLDLLIQVGTVAPEVLIIDLNDVDWQKFEMLRRITSSSRLSHVKVIALSALSERDLRSEVGKVDRVTLVPPDVDATPFLAAVHECLGWSLGGEEGGKTPSMADVAPGTPMLGFVTLPNEPSRLLAVKRSGLAGAAPETTFDDLTRLASQTLRTPICLLSILTSDQQWFKSHWGLDVSQTPRAWSFCNHTIQADEIFVVQDATLDERFKQNPLVIGYPNIRFYAGFPIRDVDGFPLGALCVIDRRPRTLGAAQVEALHTIAAAVADKINLRLRERQLRAVPSGTIGD